MIYLAFGDVFTAVCVLLSYCEAFKMNLQVLRFMYHDFHSNLFFAQGLKRLIMGKEKTISNIIVYGE